MKKSRWLSEIAFFLATIAAMAQPVPAAPVGGPRVGSTASTDVSKGTNSTKKQYTVEDIFTPQDVSESQPTEMEWSPDGSKLAYLQYGAGSGQESLYCFDAAIGRSTRLIAADKLAALLSSAGNLRDDRQRENRIRFRVADYHWAPDSKNLLFEAQGQLWIFDLVAGKGRQLTAVVEPASDPKFSPDGKFLSYVRGHNLYARLISGAEFALTSGGNVSLLNGEVDWLYSEELEVRSNYFWSPDAKQILYLQMNEAAVPQYPIVDWIPTRHRD